MFTIYLLASTVVVPIVGKLSDMFGRRPFVIGGLLVFVLGSAGAGLSPSMPMLIAARGVQGIGAGMILACVLIVMADLYTPSSGRSTWAMSSSSSRRRRSSVRPWESS